MPQHDRLVDLRLAEPRALLSRGEDLDGHVAAPPLPPPHLAEATLPDDLLQHDGPRHCPLHKQGQACGGQRTPEVSYTGLEEYHITETVLAVSVQFIIN